MVAFLIGGGPRDLHINRTSPDPICACFCAIRLIWPAGVACVGALVSNSIPWKAAGPILYTNSFLNHSINSVSPCAGVSDEAAIVRNLFSSRPCFHCMLFCSPIFSDSWVAETCHASLLCFAAFSTGCVDWQVWSLINWVLDADFLQQREISILWITQFSIGPCPGLDAFLLPRRKLYMAVDSQGDLNNEVGALWGPPLRLLAQEALRSAGPYFFLIDGYLNLDWLLICRVCVLMRRNMVGLDFQFSVFSK